MTGNYEEYCSDSEVWNVYIAFVMPLFPQIWHSRLDRSGPRHVVCNYSSLSLQSYLSRIV